jgi:hypothetical protein
MTGIARPIFVVGSPRSGTSILTWCLGQHPAILPIEETNWIAKFGAGLGSVYELGASRGAHSQLSAAGIGIEEFFQHFGDAIDALILRAGTRSGTRGEGAFQLWRSPLDPKTRWVDGTPEYSHDIALLAKLFPQAKFIHILRDVSSVVKSLMNFANVGATNLSEQEAYETWLRAVCACVAAEEALGPETVLRVTHDELSEAPLALLRRCLDFVGEPFCADCLEPLHKKINSSNVPPDFDPRDERTDPRLRDEAESLSRELLSGVAERGRPFPAISRYARSESVLPLRHLEKSRSRAQVLQRIRQVVDTTLPPDALAVVVSKGDDELLQLERRKAWHFPQAANGGYAGHHPADSREAISQLEAVRAKGADFLLFPPSAFWWFDHYSGFRSHLDARFRRVWNDESCVIYRL